MGAARWFMGAVVLVFSTVGIIGCVVGSIGIWMFCQTASERAQNIFTRLDTGLERAAAVSQTVRQAVDKARKDVARADRESANLAEGGEKSNRAARSLRTLVQKQIAPGVDNLGGRLATLSDAAVALSAVLESLQELPGGGTGRIKPNTLERWGDEAQQLSATLRRLEGVVGDENRGSAAHEVTAATSAVDLALQRCQTTLDEWQDNLDLVREGLPQVRTTVNHWLGLTPIGVSLVCLWMILAQMSLFARALKWCRRSPACSSDSFRLE